MTKKTLAEQLYAHYIRVTPEECLQSSAEHADKEAHVKWVEDHPDLARALENMVGKMMVLSRDRRTVEGYVLPKGTTYEIVETFKGALYGQNMGGLFIGLEPAWVEFFGETG